MNSTENRSAGPNRPGSAANAGSTRWIALGLGLAIILLVALFLAIPYLATDETRLNVTAPIAPAPGLERGGWHLAGTVHVWQVSGRLTIDAQRRVQASFDLIGPGGWPPPEGFAPRMVLDMPEHGMEVLRPRLVRVGPGSYVADASLPMDGRWRLSLELPEVTGVFAFDTSG
jgi:hypothetical protein